MMKEIALTVLVLAICYADDSGSADSLPKNGGRQKRLLFYDEEGNLVKTYKNPYLYDFAQNADKFPFLGNFFNPFFSYLRPNFGGPTAYMIPVSDDVIQQINRDPFYQNKLLTLPKNDMVVEPNPLCAGKRSQIPSKRCSNFLNCWDGWAFEQQCPEGLLFASDGYCDYSHNVDCSTRTKCTCYIDEPTASLPMKCNKDFEAFRDEHRCSEFFVCVDRVPIKFKCPADLAYNQELGVCDYAYRVNCNDSMTMAEAPMQKPCAPTPESSTLAPAPPQTARISTPASDIKTVLTSNAVYNTQSWSSSHVAISRQDAIRQLNLEGTTA